MSDALPEGWTCTTLGVVGNVNPRHPRDLDDDLIVTFVPMPVVSESDWKIAAVQERPIGEVKTGYTHFADGDVLFAKITPCMENGKAAVATDLSNGLGCGSTEFHVLRPHLGIDAKYLYHFVHQESFRKEAANNFTGTAGQSRVPVKFMRTAELPLPPTAEQRRIVDQIETLRGKIRSSQQRLDRIPKILKRFRRAVLGAAPRPNREVLKRGASHA
jgi:type I restriction enzyme, S subunit